MTDKMTADTESAAAIADESHGLLRQVALIALCAVLLGLGIQLLILVARLAAGGPWPGAALLADTAGGVTWALLVCTGVGIGTSVLRVRAMLAGLLAAICAPIAIAAAKAAQRMVAGMTDAVEQQAILSLGSISLARAVEYGVLGFLLGTLAQRGEKRVSRYLGAGCLVGLVLGGAVVWLTHYVAAQAGSGLTSAQLAVGVVNEMVFPVGCAIVIYAGQLVGRSFSRAELALT